MADSATRKILIVEDDDQFREKLKTSLESLGYLVVTAINGKIAQNLTGVDDFDLIITDIRMPEVNGIHLLHYIKRTHAIPVILMTGYPEFQDPQEAYEMGASYFLSKPFKKDELQKALAVSFKEPIPESSTDDNATKKEDTNDSLFCKLDIDDFVSGRELLYDIYIRLSDDKYIKIAPQGDTLSPERIASYKAKKMKFLYMRKEDFKKYVGFSVNLAKVIKTTNAIDKNKKIQFLKHATDVVLTQLHVEGVNEESYENAKTVTESTMSIMSDSSEMMGLIDLLSNHSNYLYSHSLGVSIHATMIAKNVGWKSPLVLFKLSMGGLLHDIGKKEIPEEVLNKHRTLLNPTEQKLLESHTIRGADILNKLSYIPTDVVQIAAQHHENCLGLGYPNGLKGKFIHPLARVVSVANEFCDLVLKSPNNPNPPKAEDAIRKMAITFGEALDPIFFGALAKIYKVKIDATSDDPGKKKKKYENI